MDEIIYLSDDEEPMVILQNEDGINNELTRKNCSSGQSADQIDKTTGEKRQMMEQSTSSQQKPMEEVNEDEEEEDECKIVYVKGYQADPLGDKAKGIRSWIEDQGVQLHLPRQNFTSENAENEKDNAMDNGEGTSAASSAAGPENGGKTSKKLASIKKRPKKAAKPKGIGILVTNKEPKNGGKTSTKRAPKKRMMAVKSKNDGGVVETTKKPEKGGKTSAKGAPIKKRPKRAMTKKSKKAPAKPKKGDGNGVQNNEKDVYLVQKILKMINNGRGATKQTYLCQIRDTKGQIKEAEVNSKKINKKMLNKFKKSMTEEAKLYRIEAITNVRIKKGNPEYLVKWKGYVKKDWVPQANLNIDVDEGNKKCILDLAKKTHKIGQPMEEEELELAYQFVCECLAKEL